MWQLLTSTVDAESARDKQARAPSDAPTLQALGLRTAGLRLGVDAVAADLPTALQAMS